MTQTILVHSLEYDPIPPFPLLSLSFSSLTNNSGGLLLDSMQASKDEVAEHWATGGEALALHKEGSYL